MNRTYKDYSFPRSILEIDLNKLKSNYDLLKKMCSNETFFCSMVKDQAYGHGVIPITQALLEKGVKQVGVIDIPEALQLREFIKEPFDILVFGPLLSEESLSWAVDNNITLVVNNWVDLKHLEKRKKIKIHLKFNTGFSRLGFPLSEAERIKKFLDKNPHIQLEALCTQLVSGEELTDTNSFSHQQIKQMQTLQSVFPSTFLHIFNTSALCSIYVSGLVEKFSSIGVRPGIGLYGIKPEIYLTDKSMEQKWRELFLEPISCLKSYVVNVHKLNKGDKVSYSGSWVAQRPSTLVTISLGYGDGFFRSFNSQREILFRGQRVPIVGAVCMDFFMVDVTDCFTGKESDSIFLGEEVVIFGQQGESFLSIEDQSQKVGTIAYEFLVRLGERVGRVYIR